MAKYPLTNKGAKYARDIVSGKIPACLYVRQACQRQIDDLKKESKQNFPYRFDKDKAERACSFYEMLPHQKGKWRGQSLVLEPWQCFSISVVFGWVKKKDEKRRFTEAIKIVPRKNGKSLDAAGSGLYIGFADNEPGSEVYCAATTEKQAFEVHRPMWTMCYMLPSFRKKFGIELSGTMKNPGAIFSLQSGSRADVVVGNPPDGASPALWIQDEYHESKDSRSYDTGITGMASREQPLMLVITTAGTDTSYPCYELILEGRKVLSGESVNESLFYIEYTIDIDDDWQDFENWKKANPNFGVSVSEEFLRKQLDTALRSSRKQNIIKCKHLNVWSNAGNSWLNMAEWEMAADPTLDINDFLGEKCYLGGDFSSKIDITSLMPLFKRKIENKNHYYLLSKHFIPEERTFGEENSHYAGWVHDEYIETTSGARIDFNRVEECIEEFAKKVDLAGEENGGGAFCYDPWGAQQLVTNLETKGISTIEIPQVVSNLSEPMKEIEAALKDGTFHHDGNPVTTWMFSNVCCKVDKNDNIFPFKESRKNKIDGAVATTNAMARAMYDIIPTEKKESRYEKEDQRVKTFGRL